MSRHHRFENEDLDALHNELIGIHNMLALILSELRKMTADIH